MTKSRAPSAMAVATTIIHPPSLTGTSFSVAVAPDDPQRRLRRALRAARLASAWRRRSTLQQRLGRWKHLPVEHMVVIDRQASRFGAADAAQRASDERAAVHPARLRRRPPCRD